MDKDAYYFPHFSNARHDRKLKRVRKELGVEGYGIYFMLLETLRDQEFFKYPIDDLDLLADEFGTSEQKVRTVICNYNLFQVDNEQNFFSLKFVEYLQPYLDTKHRNKINGIKGNLIKYNYITREVAENLSDYEIIELNEHRKELLSLPVAGESGGDKPSDRKERKESKESKESKENVIADVIEFYSRLQSLPKVIKWTDKRKGNINARINDYGIEEVEKALSLANCSDFLTGKVKSNGKVFIADIDWILNTNNFVKILEGKYANKQNISTESDYEDPNPFAYRGDK